MSELDRHRDELKVSQNEVSRLNRLLSSRDSVIRELCASKKLVSQELEIARCDIKVLEGESRLEGMDRQNLKFTNLSTHYKPGLALELNPSPKERGNKADEHSDLFYRVSVLKNLVPVEVVTKTGSLSTLSLSQTVI